MRGAAAHLKKLALQESTSAGCRAPAAQLKQDHARLGGAVGPFFVTPHAVWRYIERVRPGISYRQALHDLIAQGRGAHRVKQLDSGHELWRGPKPRRLRLLVAPASGGGLPQLVTILTTFDGWTP